MPRQFLRRQPADAEPTAEPPRRRPGHAATTVPIAPVPAPAVPARHPQPQFQTPSRQPPPARQFRGHSPASVHAAMFSLFGRGVAERPRREMMDEDDEDDGAARGLREVNADEGFEDDEEEVVDDDDEGDEEIDPEAAVEGEAEDEDEDETMHDRDKSPSPPLPPNLREISNLASWTVSTNKPSFGVTALRHPSPTQYWQSDGPQPHTLTLHFFKLVAIVKIRVLLNFELDESYTPTKMVFLAGMGGNDLVEFGAWEGDAPCGWVEVPLAGVGGRHGAWDSRQKRRGGKGKSVAEEDEEDEEDSPDEEDDDDEYAGSVLKAMVVQMRVIENHQNGKDTHVRGFQVFARDDDRRRIGMAPSASADLRPHRHSARKSLRKDELDDVGKTTGLDEPDWMGEPVIR